MRIWSLLIFLLWATSLAADIPCTSVRKSNFRYWEMVGFTSSGVAGFLANPGTEGHVSEGGAWFAPGTLFEVYPNIKILSGGVPRVLVMGDNGVYAAVQLSALTCFSRDRVDEEESLSTGPRVLVGRHSDYGSRKHTSCGSKLTSTSAQKLEWEFNPFKIVSIGGEISWSQKIEFDPAYSQSIFRFYDKGGNQHVQVREVQGCEGGTANNKPRWEIQVGEASPFTLTRATLEKFGVTEFSEFTGKPIISCKAQLDTIRNILSETPLSAVFENQVAGVIGQWKNFRDFSTCDQPAVRAS